MTTIQLSPAQELRQAMAECHACALRDEGCLRPVAGDFPRAPRARVALVGEAPGLHEDRFGKPFVGQAGQLLNLLLRHIGLDRSEVLVTNVAHCRPANNRTPTLAEAAFCGELWLERELAVARPEIIVAVGVTSARYFLGREAVPTLQRVERVPHRIETFWGEAAVLPIRHPAAILHAAGEHDNERAAKLVGGGFLALRRLLDEGAPVDEYAGREDYRELTIPSAVAGWFAGAGEEVGIDSEDNSDGTLATVQLACEPGAGILIRARSDLLQAAAEGMRGRTAIFQNAVHDLPRLARAGIAVERFHDTMQAAYNLQAPSIGLKELCAERLGMHMRHFAEVFPDGFENGSHDDQVHYGCRDADGPLRLWPVLRDELAREGLWEVYETDLACLPIWAEMMANGVHIDRAHFERLRVDFEGRVERALGVCREHATGFVPDVKNAKAREAGFNPNSPIQVSQLLFDHLRLPHPNGKRTTKGWSTDVHVLEAMAKTQPVARAILDYRHVTKLLGTYILPIPRWADEHGRVHGTIKAMKTETGRPAMEDPDLLNIPVRSDEAKDIRDGFDAEEGWTLLAVDLSQIELRADAHLSRDPIFIRSFLRGEDIHRATAALILRRNPEDIDFRARRDAKKQNFGIPFGLSAQGILDNMRADGIDLEGEGYTLAWAEDYQRKHFNLHPAVRLQMDAWAAEAARTGVIRDLIGRRRYIWEAVLGPVNKHLRGSGERMAYNMPVQATAAEIIKKAMANIKRDLDARGLSQDVRWLLQIYDDLMFEVRDGLVEQVARLVYRHFLTAMSLCVPLDAEVKVGERWGSMKVLELGEEAR